jgi:hypothetical protein
MGEGTVERKSGVGFIFGPSYSYSYSYLILLLKTRTSLVAR